MCTERPLRNPAGQKATAEGLNVRWKRLACWDTPCLMCFTQCVRILDEQRVHQAAMMLRELNVFNRSNTVTTYIGNAFSLGMVPRHLLGRVRLTPCDRPDVAGLVSCVGHADTAAVLGVPMARISVTLNEGDILYVAQLRGGRLPEGSTTLPEGFGFDWIRVEVI